MKLFSSISSKVFGWTAVGLFVALLGATSAAALFHANAKAQEQRANTADQSLTTERTAWLDTKMQLVADATRLSKDLQREKTLREVDSRQIAASLEREKSLVAAMGISDRQLKERINADKNPDAGRWAVALVPASVLDDSLRSAVEAGRKSFGADAHKDGDGRNSLSDAAAVRYQSAALF